MAKKLWLKMIFKNIFWQRLSFREDCGRFLNTAQVHSSPGSNRQSHLKVLTRSNNSQSLFVSYAAFTILNILSVCTESTRQSPKPTFLAATNHRWSLFADPLMENLISLVNKIQRACTALGDYGEESTLPTLWDALPAIAVVGGQVRSRFRIRILIWKILCWF